MEEVNYTYLAIVAAVVLAGVYYVNRTPRGSAHTGYDTANPANWEIGPVIDWKNHSKNMPLRPAPHPEGWVIELPHPSEEVGSAHYITLPSKPMLGHGRITLELRVEADPGVRIVPRKFPNGTGRLTLYFQREGDRWTERTEDYRWYASFASIALVPGDYTVSASLSGPWTAVLRSSRENNPGGFHEALMETARVGFVLGGGDGAGHGVYATGPARLVVKSFKVE